MAVRNTGVVPPGMGALELDAREAQARLNKPPLFSSEAPVPFTLASDFTRISEKGDDLHNWLGAVASVPAQLTVAGSTASAKLELRGNSSLMELPLPKLRMKVGTDGFVAPFEPKQKVDIGVHGNRIGATVSRPFSGLGRELDDYAPRREAAAYAVLEELGLPVPATRVGDTTYVDTKGDANPTNDIVDAGHSTLLLESLGALAHRWGATHAKTKEELVGAPVRAEDIALFKLGEALVGNKDYSLTTTAAQDAGARLFYSSNNAALLRFEDGWGRPVPFDFDMSAWTLTRGSRSQTGWLPPQGFASAIDGAAQELPEEARLPFFERLLARREAAANRLAGYPLLEDDVQKPYLAARIEAFFDAVAAKVRELKAAPAGERL